MPSKATLANNLFASVSLLLFIGAIAFLSVEMGRITKLEDDLKKEKLISESQLSEKLLVEKARDKSELFYHQQKTASADLNRELELLKQALAEKER